MTIPLEIAIPIATALCAAVAALWLKQGKSADEQLRHRENTARENALELAGLHADHAREIADARVQQLSEMRQATAEFAKLTGEVARAVERMADEQARAAAATNAALDRLSNLVNVLVGRETR